ncbi:MAG TPA: o-succinylbenzoate synthase [Acidobacteriaceae bacterium]|jgi:O-succinylbenzoate synthase|nr:o-succinylbenzoate synthase [Acidobacteriaceae bacterium]
MMKIAAIHAREINMQLISPFETSFGVTHNRRILLLELHLEDGSCGWSEVTAAEGPFYNAETTDTAWSVLRSFLIPLLLEKTFDGPEEVRSAMGPVRGHEMAKAALETAVWDALANSRSMSLSKLLGGTRSEISSGVSLGIHEDTGKLLDRIAQELAAGYQRVKLKIKPGKDVEVVSAVRKKYPHIALTVDANSAYRLTDISLLKQLDAFNLTYIEQPLEWNEIYQHSVLQRELNTPICLDECIHNLRDAQAAIELGACKVINIKLGRVSGHTVARRIQAYCMERGVPVWCGGMLESGIGRAHNIAMSSLPGFVLPGDVSASKRYWEEDIIVPAVEVSAHGTIEVPDSPGIGFTVNKKRIEKLTVRQEEWNTKQSVGATAR